MKMFKKITAIILALAVMLTLAACHPKDEVAISAGDYKITSAMYSYFLTLADSEAKNLINGDSSIDTKASGFSYYKQKIEDKPFEEYVKETALNNCLRYITLEKLCAEKKFELDAETKSGWQSTAQYYWTYSLGAIMLQNGVSYATYEKIMLNDALYNLYFDKTYGKDGEKAVADADVKKGLDENYIAVYKISHDYSSEEKPDVDKIKEKLNKYVEMLNKGDAFADVLSAYNTDNSSGSSSNTSSTTTSSTSSETSSTTSSTDSSTTSSNTSSTTSSTDSSSTTSSNKEEEKKPVDSNISIFSKYEDTYTSGSVYFSKFADVAKMEKDAVSLIHDENAKVFYIVVKKDINEDPYYLETLTEEIIYLLKGDEYDKFLDDTAKALDYTVNDYAVNQFKVKKIYDGSEA